jgi:hypothetical protein
VSVSAPAGCAWTANSQNFVSVTSGSNGNGNGTVNFLVAANTGGARSTSLTIAGQLFTVLQSGATANSYSLAASPSTVAAGGQLTLNWTAPSGSSVFDWIALYRVGDSSYEYGWWQFTNGSTSGTVTLTAPFQSGQYEFRYLLNSTFNVAATSGTITVQSVTTPTPTPTPVCTYAITPASQNFGSEGGNAAVSVAAPNGCGWTVVNNNSWINFNSAGSIGNGTVTFSVSANSGQARAGTISIAGQTLTVNQAAATVVSARTPYDFDGDGRADISVYRPASGAWYLLNSASGFTGTQFGISTDKLAPADFDGDGKTDLAVFRDGAWYLLRSRDGFTGVSFGQAGDVPAPADFDGDGGAELAVFRPSAVTLFKLNLANNQTVAVKFGKTGDKPVLADYDGDGKADYAVFRPTDGAWYILQSQNGFTGVQFGIATDIPVAGDYDGDGKADPAVYRGGAWYQLRSSQGFASVQFGIASDVPAPADYDGDGKSDAAVFRDGVWHLLRSAEGYQGVQFGQTADKPARISAAP